MDHLQKQMVNFQIVNQLIVRVLLVFIVHLKILLLEKMLPIVVVWKLDV